MQSYLWAFNVSDWKVNRKDLNFASRFIGNEEKMRILKYYFIKDAKTAIVSQLLQSLLIYQIKHYYKNKNIFCKIDKIKGEFGKPYVILNDVSSLYTNKKYFYNVSHHGSYVVLASSSHFNLGIDIMSLDNFCSKKLNGECMIYHNNKDLNSYFATMQAVFTHNEWAFIKDSGNLQIQLSKFLLIWSLKESFLKMTGNGIQNKKLKEIEFDNLTSQIKKVSYINDIENPLTLKYDETQINDDCLECGPSIKINNEEMNQYKFYIGTLGPTHIVSLAYDIKVDTGSENIQDFYKLLENQPKKFEILTFDQLRLIDKYEDNNLIDKVFVDHIIKKISPNFYE